MQLANVRAVLFATVGLTFISIHFAGPVQAQTPWVESGGAEVTASGFTGLCLGCSISNIDNLVSNDLTSTTQISITAGVAASGFACVKLDRAIPAGRTAGFVGILNGGLAGLLDNTVLTIRLDGQNQQSLSGSGSLVTIGGVGGGNNVAGLFTEPFDEICFFGNSLVAVTAAYTLRYAFTIEASAQQSTLTAYPGSITANGTAQATITLQANDSLGTPLEFGGDTVTLATTAGILSSSVVDHGDGTYTATLTSSSTVETATVTGTINGQLLTDTATVDFVTDSGGGADAGATRINAAPSKILADGADVSTITVEARDAFGNPLTSGGDAVTLSTTAGNLSAVADNGDGSYTATLTASSTVETATITGTINAVTIGDSATVSFASSVDADHTQSSISADPDTLPADGSSVSVITVQVADSSGTPLTIGGDSVEIFTTAGTLGATVIDHDDGTYTTTLTAPAAAGTAEITGTLNGMPIAGTTQVTFFATFADADTSLLNAYPLAITANGTAESVITVEARDGGGNPIGTGGDTVTLSTTAGILSSSVVDHGDGTYTATLTSSSTVETATVTGTINGQPLTDTATVDFVTDSGGGADAGATRINAAPSKILADGADVSTITVEARDAFGNPLTSGGDAVTLSTTAGNLSAVADNGDGSYTATLTASSTVETATITGTINAATIGDSATVSFDSSVDADHTQSSISADPDTLPADGSSVSVITVQVADSSGTPLTIGGDSVEIFTTAGTLGATVIDHDDGTYTTTLTAPAAAGTAEITGTLNGMPIAGTTQVTFYDANQADPSQTTISAYPATISANGTAQAVITVEARNAGGDLTGNGGDDIFLSTTAGTIGSSVTDHGDGTYSALLTSSTNVETAVVSGTINGDVINSTASVSFVDASDGSADADATRISVSPSTIPADGSSTATATVEARDSLGNPLTSGGDVVTISTTSGGISGVTDHGDGTYTAVITAPTSTGEATITGTINGESIGNATVLVFASFVEVDPSQSFITVDPTSLPADGSSTAIITVQAVDSNGDPMTSGGDNVTLYTTAGTLATTVTDNDDGTYTAVITAPNQSSTALISGTINGVQIGGTARVLFGDDDIFADRFEATF